MTDEVEDGNEWDVTGYDDLPHHSREECFDPLCWCHDAEEVP